MTNADMIRNMTDEELAEFFPCGDCFCCPVDTITNYPKEGCDDCALDWLKQEVEE